MALFEVDADHYLPAGATRGPWDEHAMNGGAVAALVARAAERHEDEGAPVLPDQLVARLTIDLVRPAPLRPLVVRTTTLRPGRKVQLVEVLVQAEGRVVTRAVALRMPAGRTDMPVHVEPAPPGPEHGVALGPMDGPVRELFHADGVQLLAQRPDDQTISPTVIWVRMLQPVVAGETPSPLVRAAVASDFGSGLSSVNPPGFRSINTDITVHLFRPPVGEWVAFAARSRHGAGVGQAAGGLYDLQGRIGSATQTVLVEPWQWASEDPSAGPATVG